MTNEHIARDEEAREESSEMAIMVELGDNVEQVDIVTPGNVDALKEQLPTDQARQLISECRTWPITHECGQSGQMTVWPNGRAAISLGGDSSWGEWICGVLHTDDGENKYNVRGESA